MEFITYLVFTHKPGESYRRPLRSSFLVVLVLRISRANYLPCVLIRQPILIADTYITIVFLFAERKVSACSYTAAVAENARKATCNSL